MKGTSVLEGRACWSGCVPVGEDVSFESRHILVRECVSFWMGCVWEQVFPRGSWHLLEGECPCGNSPVIVMGRVLLGGGVALQEWAHPCGRVTWSGCVFRNEAWSCERGVSLWEGEYLWIEVYLCWRCFLVEGGVSL